RHPGGNGRAVFDRPAGSYKRPVGRSACFSWSHLHRGLAARESSPCRFSKQPWRAVHLSGQPATPLADLERLPPEELARPEQPHTRTRKGCPVRAATVVQRETARAA